MEIVHSLEKITSNISNGTCVTWGNFDGVHLGHQKLLRHLCSKARANGLKSVLITFCPHPLQIVGTPPPIITPMQFRLALISKIGVDIALVLPFTKELSELEPEEFVHKLFASALNTKEMVLGYSSFFGKGRRGSAVLLSRMGAELGFNVEQLPPVLLGGAVISSTRVRRLITDGDVASVDALLGRRHFVEGIVVKGRQLGRKLGFPTLNLAPPPVEATNFYTCCCREQDADARGGMLPASGVYAAWVEHKGIFHRAVASIGTNPTFEAEHGQAKTILEAHLLNFSADLYGETVRIYFVKQLRPQFRFPSPQDLINQINIDIEKTEKIL